MALTKTRLLKHDFPVHGILPPKQWIPRRFLGSSQTWWFQTWLFANFTRKLSFAPFCAILRSCADLRLRSFPRICTHLHSIECLCVQPALETTAFGNFRNFLMSSLRAQRLKKIQSRLNFHSHLKSSIALENFKPDLQNSPQKIGVWWAARAWNFQSRLKFSRSWIFSIFGPLGFLCNFEIAPPPLALPKSLHK